MAAEHESWKPEDDAKLAALFRKTDRNGKPVVNLTDLSKKYIELVHTTYFKAKKFSNFQPLYKRKVRKWNLEQTLQGARRGPAPKQSKKAASQKAAPTVEEASDEEEDDDFVEDDIGEEEVDGLIDNQETDPVGIPSVAEKFASISLSDKKKAAKMAASSSAYKMDYIYPHMMHDYVDDDRRHVTLDFLVPSMAEKMFRPSVNVSDQSLKLATVVPPFFASKGRLMAAFAAETGFGENTHRATAMGEVCDEVKKDYDDAKSDETIIIGLPQRVKLPFPCEEEIVHWECQLFSNEDQECEDDTGVSTYFNVLSIDLVGAAKKKKKKKGGTRAIGSPVQSLAPTNRTNTTAKGSGAAKVDEENMDEH